MTLNKTPLSVIHSLLAKAGRFFFKDSLIIFGPTYIEIQVDSTPRLNKNSL